MHIQYNWLLLALLGALSLFDGLATLHEVHRAAGLDIELNPIFRVVLEGGAPAVLLVKAAPVALLAFLPARRSIMWTLVCGFSLLAVYHVILNLGVFV